MGVINCQEQTEPSVSHFAWAINENRRSDQAAAGDIVPGDFDVTFM